MHALTHVSYWDYLAVWTCFQLVYNRLVTADSTLCVGCCRKEGAVEVRSQAEAQQAVQAAADAIHGLGRGGNVPQALPQAAHAGAPGTAACAMQYTSPHC